MLLPVPRSRDVPPAANASLPDPVARRYCRAHGGPSFGGVRMVEGRQHSAYCERMSDSISDNLRRVQDRIANAAIAAGRKPEDITLVAVSKTKPVEAIVAALAAGQMVFGENRVQEAAGKFPALRP